MEEYRLFGDFAQPSLRLFFSFLLLLLSLYSRCWEKIFCIMQEMYGQLFKLDITSCWSRPLVYSGREANPDSSRRLKGSNLSLYSRHFASERQHRERGRKAVRHDGCSRFRRVMESAVPFCDFSQLLRFWIA